ncbi:predicted protein [Sclerotinia sclerotiorum 1980 UF-70]|uniref:Uncharacterized protein n=1 Tax=Sclerotinia sclerotiorum (strain ATCC 18683 / 1980 / Ss-1) TaxID=665079 RepID=A7F735_SCLS1|nr:predicted protein [Sclerotinia sclerotiorum 1980 UF-70]EDN98556.1 predicted protein [Sclerotinia sclerotiorum 1980 UF-70]
MLPLPLSGVYSVYIIMVCTAEYNTKGKVTPSGMKSERAVRITIFILSITWRDIDVPCGDEMDKIVPLYEGGIAWIIWTDIVQQFVKSSVLVVHCIWSTYYIPPWREASTEYSGVNSYDIIHEGWRGNTNNKIHSRKKTLRFKNLPQSCKDAQLRLNFAQLAACFIL